MANCQKCGRKLVDNVNLCPTCGVQVNDCPSSNNSTSNLTQTVATIAGTVVGASVLSRLLFRRRRPFMMPTYHHQFHRPRSRGPRFPRGSHHFK